MSAWREALRMLRVRQVASVWAATLTLAVLGVLWLQIPDSHLWEFVFSILFACGFLALFFWFYSWVFGQMLKPAEVERLVVAMDTAGCGDCCLVAVADSHRQAG